METLKTTTEKENIRIKEQKILIENRLKEVEPLLKVCKIILFQKILISVFCQNFLKSLYMKNFRNNQN